MLTAVLRKYCDAALPFVAELMPALGALLEPGRDPEERRIAICILDDILEHCPAGAHTLAHHVTARGCRVFRLSSATWTLSWSTLCRCAHAGAPAWCFTVKGSRV